ncbi:FusB/FusC family EF-G-binding protein [Gracilibacillus thailandensis]|uniref:Elongation factor G-binding protein n=1 Tax=Gracilibacillus thailandensis TaxID=563735 RepID=A0A6N7QVE3_9BACI|nr:FusB/FusC family EF-G-binding protein [Gracilibacillus thailandensis]MRI65978.1 elongation factor G-binding protein [Gracilibacillus thailandensis]
MEAFIHPHQFHHIKQQAKRVVSAQSHSNDQQVIAAVKEIAMEALEKQLPDQQETLTAIRTMKAKEDMEPFLEQVKQYVIPFPMVSDKQIQKAFPKAKKLQIPDLEQIDRKETVYLRWYDKGSGKTYMLIPKENKLIGIQGYLESTQHKGICTICNGLEDVSLFTTARKGQIRGTYSKKGNYICKDPVTCNRNITNIDPLHQFMEHLKA